MFFQRPRPGFSDLTAARIASRSDFGQSLPGSTKLSLTDFIMLSLNFVIDPPLLLR